MRFQALKKRSFLIAIIMVLSIMASASYAVAMPLFMTSASECTMESSSCDMCCIMSNSDSQPKLFGDYVVATLKPAPIGVPDSIPLPFYHPPG